MQGFGLAANGFKRREVWALGPRRCVLIVLTTAPHC